MTISIIGCGAMGGAMAEGWLKSGALAPNEMTAADPCAANLSRFEGSCMTLTSDNVAAARGKDIVFVVVKPWLVGTVLEGIMPALTKEQTLVVVAAGVSMREISHFTNHFPNIVRAIPNTGIAVKSSMTFIVPSDDIAAERVDSVKALFSAVGSCMQIDEAHLPAATALASCGIAYAMRYVRAASEGGVQLGFKADQAKDIVLQTMKGAVELLQQSGAHPEAEIDKVTTPGGVTIKGLNAMEKNGFTNAVIEGLIASCP